ncbi:ATP synthase subunit I [Polyangium jinanense]|uniref:ATP synthase subunit I n=1 Tax=Polyangium jinanense TaxID=2829994 RepID=A0A9X3WWU5_9BACT|nr:ATP synthase subunit I [Polyangium jinanense]MDC3953231.1 ATP synthase subunit I [Polyangium jinanense]MDC3979649.1 ATP synthase subunit I [Polyangium jinanense]
MSDDAQKPSKLDAQMRAALFGVIGTGVVLSLGAFAFGGPRFGIGVAIGGALAPMNLWVFAQVGEAFLSRRGNTAPWAVIATIKLALLLGGVWLILRSGIASGLSLIVGYGALPIGITVGTLFGPKPPEDLPEGDGRRTAGPGSQTSRRSFGDAPREDVLKARPADEGDPSNEP